GVTLVDLGKWQEAVEVWSKGAAIQKDGSYEYNIGIQYANHGNIDLAKEWYIKSARKGYSFAKEILDKNGVPY
ncbi:MAG: hypothetical protein MUF45_16670, partial [Spirosomaceae bacterium]|nr:hypothetical protein [Spirosomataceae bacterium]